MSASRATPIAIFRRSCELCCNLRGMTSFIHTDADLAAGMAAFVVVLDPRLAPVLENYFPAPIRCCGLWA